MEECLVFFEHLTNFFDWLHDSNFIVNMDDTADQSVWSQSCLESFKVDKTGRKLNREVCHLEALVFKFSARVEHALVIYLRGYDVLLLVSIEVGDTLQAQVVRLSRSTGEDNLLGLSTDYVRNLFSGVFAGNFCVPSKLMRFGMWVTIVVCEPWHHLVEYSWVGWSC